MRRCDARRPKQRPVKGASDADSKSELRACQQALAFSGVDRTRLGRVRRVDCRTLRELRHRIPAMRDPESASSEARIWRQLRGPRWRCWLAVLERSRLLY